MHWNENLAIDIRNCDTVYLVFFLVYFYHYILACGVSWYCEDTVAILDRKCDSGHLCNKGGLYTHFRSAEAPRNWYIYADPLLSDGPAHTHPKAICMSFSLPL